MRGRPLVRRVILEEARQCSQPYVKNPRRNTGSRQRTLTLTLQTTRGWMCRSARNNSGTLVQHLADRRAGLEGSHRPHRSGRGNRRHPCTTTWRGKWSGNGWRAGRDFGASFRDRDRRRRSNRAFLLATLHVRRDAIVRRECSEYFYGQTDMRQSSQLGTSNGRECRSQSHSACS